MKKMNIINTKVQYLYIVNVGCCTSFLTFTVTTSLKFPVYKYFYKNKTIISYINFVCTVTSSYAVTMNVPFTFYNR